MVPTGQGCSFPLANKEISDLTLCLISGPPRPDLEDRVSGAVQTPAPPRIPAQAVGRRPPSPRAQIYGPSRPPAPETVSFPKSQTVEWKTRPGLGKRPGLEAEPSAAGIRRTGRTARRSGVSALCAVRPGPCGFPGSGEASLGFLAGRD